MLIKLIGSILIVAGCTGFGIAINLSHRRTVKQLKQLMSAIAYMENELQYRSTPLPELCIKASNICDGYVKKFFEQLEKEMLMQIRPDPKSCVIAAIAKINEFPAAFHLVLEKFGATLGSFGICGQVGCFREVIAHCEELYIQLTEGENRRLQSYQTIAVCAGAALVILLM